MRLPFIGLRAKLFLFAFVVILPFLAFTIYGYERSRGGLSTRYAHEQLARAQRIALLVDNAFDDSLDYGMMLGSDPSVQSMQPEPITARLQEIASRPNQARNISVWDAQGKNVASVLPLPDSVDVNVADLPHFRQAMETNQPVISDAFRGRILTDRDVVVVATPVRDATGRPIGTVHVGLSLDDSLRAPVSLESNSESDVVVVDRAGRVAFASGNNRQVWQGRDLSTYPPVRAAMTGETVTDREAIVPQLEGTYTTVWTPANKHRWVVGMVAPSGAAARPIAEALRWLLVGIVAVSLLATVLALALSSYLVKPIQRLIDNVQAIGRGDLHRHLSLRTSDEIEWLANSVNGMAEQIAARDAERAEFERAREEFISIVAHDLRSPITAISGHVQLLDRQLSQESLSPSAKKAIQAIRTSTSRLNAMVSDLLDASRIEASRLTLERKPVALFEFVCETLDQLRPALGEHPLSVHCDGCDPIVDADQRRLAQIISNLLTNAAKFSDPTAPIEVYVGYSGGWGRVRVVDHGRGIPPSVLPRIFNRFYRSAERAGERTEGLGLGLYIVHGLVEAHGGHVHAESTLSLGSTFTVDLPSPSGCVINAPTRSRRHT